MKNSRYHLRTLRVLRGGLVLVLLVLSCAVAAVVRLDRAQALRAGIRDTRNLAIVFSGQIERSIQSIDIILRELQRTAVELDIVGSPGTPSDTDLMEFRKILLQRRALLPQAYQIGVADLDGHLVVSTAGWPTPDISVADRDYFKDIKSNADDRLSISLPFVSRTTGNPIIAFARPLNAQDGRLLGVVFISVTTRYFENIYDTIDALTDQTFALVRRDGTLMLRHPDSGNRAMRHVPPDSEFYPIVRNGGGVFRSTGAFEPVVRWVALAPLREYPLVVSMASREDVILAPWRMLATVIVVGAALLLACAIWLLSVMSRQHRELGESHAATARKSYELEQEHEALLVKEESLDACINNIRQGLAMFGADARLVLCNDLYARMYGFPRESLPPGLALIDLLRMRQQATGFPADPEPYLRNFLTAMRRDDSFFDEYKCRDGRIIEISCHPLKRGGWVAMHEDISARRRAEAKIERLAHTDLLTGIANRSQFLNQINKARERLLNCGQPFSVFMLDLDHFKYVNDSLGHAAGDALLKQAVRRLQTSLRANDVPARLGGDEFAIIQSPPRSLSPADDVSQVMRESAIILANRIIELIAQPFDVDGHEVVVGTSIGIATAPNDGIDPDELMKKADLALYKTKAQGRNGFSFFGSDMSDEADVRRRLKSDLRAGLERREFELHYQPLVEMATGRPCGREALVRWNHPTDGLIMPDRFIALAEEVGLITSLGEWIIQAACAEAVKWPPHLKLAVNVSPAQFSKPNLFDVIMCALVESGLPPERLEIEITEQVLLKDETTHIALLHQLKNVGVSIALDDFGTGYSSLGYLKMFPFDKIKIDRSFTAEVLERAECAAIVCAVANLGHSLGITVLAEGVETEEQAQVLRAGGVSQAQGFLFGRPVPAAHLALDERGADGRAAGERR